jgi:hypothetical protein
MGVMMLKIEKIAVMAVGTGGFFQICRFLAVPPLYLTTLACWGFFCLLFSYELAGSRKRVQNGIETKTPMQLSWIAAGVLCLLVAFGFLFLWF